jgi:hypothetical protein
MSGTEDFKKVTELVELAKTELNNSKRLCSQDFALAKFY